MKKTTPILLLLLFSLSLTSAVILNSVDVSPLAPGQEGTIRIEVENILSDDAEEVSLILNFQNLPFIPIGTSEQSIDKIEEDDEEDFVFRIKASTNIEPGDYEIPYTISYAINSDERTRSGTIGVKVVANPDLVFAVSTDNPVQNRQGGITLKIINKGFFDARFVSVRILPEDFTLLSDNEEYIGEVESDDFETASFDVIFKKLNSNLKTIVEYRDFNNEKVIETINLPFRVYSEEKAIELGLIQKSNTTTYIITAIVIIILIIIWRSWRKRRRAKKSRRRE
ncbi:MAG: hypothetical protein KJ718_04195 [Nanoarchaeota archaeon]|nr:hypothetical protein [Nanoarchaeota archaeon]MBU1051729.1 hypothetical protein [Nanoarchaeota archaeon]MBU1988979.1 hypothetical protein [Nanoarchaeota archaeon]